MDYISTINKYINPESDLYRIYMIHVTLVTQKALNIAKKLELDDGKLRFIEEAGMLHDIGIIKVNDPEIGCYGDKPYLSHSDVGFEILEKNGFGPHARVALTHTGVGISKNEIIENELPLTNKEHVPITLEEKIISYSDLFFSKSPNKLWVEKSEDAVLNSIKKFGPEKVSIFKKWHRDFS
jgi:uncharacterized protein